MVNMVNMVPREAADAPNADAADTESVSAASESVSAHTESVSAHTESVSAHTESVSAHTESAGTGARIALAPDSAIHVPALYKIFDEIVVNALDQVNANGAGVRRIDITVDRASGVIEVYNDGVGLPVDVHSEHGCYAPELIFGHLLTSANYDDADERTIGGQNGIGAKACNIFSEWFEVETLDATRRLLYRQRFESNMLRTLEPVVKGVKAKAPKPYVRVRFLPDYARFSLDGLPEDVYRVMERRAYDVAALTPTRVAVTFNGTKLPVRTFEMYARMHDPGVADGGSGAAGLIHERVTVSDTFEPWEVAVKLSCSGFQQVSFVNGLNTVRGGKHVDHLIQQICKRVIEHMRKGGTKAGRALKSQQATLLKPQFIRDSIFLFVRATVPNPTFDSQAKEMLTTPAAKFAGSSKRGAGPELSDRFIERLCRMEGFVERVSAFSGLASERDTRKTDGAKRRAVYGVKKLDDAEWAGTAKSGQCTLILTEGDSAKAMAVAGLAVVGRQRYGVYPLRGKVMNVCDAPPDRVAANEEICNLKKILGLQSGREYSKDTLDELRYGSVMVMTDQDVDGSHIKGLVFNLFHRLWPSLLEIDGFMTSMLTPIVKVTHAGGAAAGGGSVTSFYNLSDFERWQREANESGGKGRWTAKYYKGLGTSTSAEARDYFRELRVITYHHEDGDGTDAAGAGGGCRDALDRSFDKRRANDRKAWLQSYDAEATLDYHALKRVCYRDFVDRDLKHFSNYDVLRSIPSVVDGLKVSQRKALFGCFKRCGGADNFPEARVAQLAAYVAEHSLFHHGEASMQGTVIGMAQQFVGAGNNLNLLQPIGQFGSRLAGGSDHASPRYIHTRLEPVARALFPREDDRVLEYLTDDGTTVEPRFYVPVIPLVLVNGANGIGTGYSTHVPCFDPRDIIRAIRYRLDDAPAEGAPPPPRMSPWYRGYRGRIGPFQGRDAMFGVVESVSATRVRVSELPVGTWTEDFKDALEALVSEHPKEVRSFTNESTDESVSFTLTFATSALASEWIAPTSDGRTAPLSRLEAALKMHSSKPLGMTNMHLFDRQGRIRRYESPEEILDEFMVERLATYARRKRWLEDALAEALRVLEQKARFVGLVVGRELDLYTIREGGGDDKSEDDTSEAAVPEYASHDLASYGLERVDGSFKYLLSMPVSSLTRRRKEALEKDRDAKRAELEAVQRATEREMYVRDLDALEKRIETSLSPK
jgi:DNA topoisomerase-2